MSEEEFLKRSKKIRIGDYVVVHYYGTRGIYKVAAICFPDFIIEVSFPKGNIIGWGCEGSKRSMYEKYNLDVNKKYWLVTNFKKICPTEIEI